MLLQKDDFAVVYLRGLLNQEANVLSRHPLPLAEDVDTAKVAIVNSIIDYKWYDTKFKSLSAPICFPTLKLKMKDYTASSMIEPSWE